MNAESFLESLRAQNASVNTVRAYRADLEEFRSIVGPDIEPREITRAQIREFLVALNSRNLKRATVRRKLAAVKSFFQWLKLDDLIEEDVTASVDAPRVPKQIPHWPSEAEMTKLLDAKLGGPFPERDHAILELLYATGVRVDELSGIDLEDFRDSDAIVIRGKGKKERFVLYGEYAKEAIEQYLPVRQKILARKGRGKMRALFFGLTAGQQVERLTVRQISRVVKSAARTQGLPARHPHAFRHAFATHMLEHGASIVAISKLLGHERLSTTELYAAISPKRMFEAYNLAHPHARA